MPKSSQDNTYVTHQTCSQMNTKHDTYCNVPVQQLHISNRSVLIQTQTQSLCHSHPTVHKTMSKQILPVLRDICANTKTHSQTDFQSKRNILNTFRGNGKVKTEQY